MRIESSYLSPLMDPKVFKKRIADAKKVIKQAGVLYDAVAVRGNSGTLFGGAFAAATGKSLILVRKTGDMSHSNYKVEGDADCGRYIFLDDFVASGKTRSITINAIYEHLSSKAEYVGTLTYGSAATSRVDWIVNDPRCPVPLHWNE